MGSCKFDLSDELLAVVGIDPQGATDDRGSMTCLSVSAQTSGMDIDHPDHVFLTRPELDD